jgi:hypothetical protein
LDESVGVMTSSVKPEIVRDCSACAGSGLGRHLPPLLVGWKMEVRLQMTKRPYTKPFLIFMIRVFSTESTEDLPKTKFKCGIVMQGTNIFEGLRGMMDAGLAKAPLPDFVRDAPMSGSCTFTVNDGSFAETDSFAAV